MSRELTYGSLFSGTGALDIGIQSVLGGETVWRSDICRVDKDGAPIGDGHHDPHRSPCAILDHHLPAVPNLGDVTKVDWSAVEPVDVITGGSPCQDVSAAGKRAGMRAGTRSGLWASMCDAIETIRPGLVVWENVRGAHSAEADSDVEPCSLGMGHGSGVLLRATGRVVGDLSELGYDSWWCTVRAADAGACHGRARVFVFAWPAADTDRQQLQGVRSLSGLRRGPDARPAMPELSSAVTLLPTPAVNDMGAAYTPETWDEWTATMQAKHGNGNGHGKSLNIEAQRLLPTPKATNNENRQSEGYGGRNGNFYGLMTGESSWGDYAAAIHRWESLTRPAPAPTQLGKKGQPQLAPAFSEWMMGLPAGHVTDPAIGLTRNEQLKALGNGVVPQQVALATWLFLAAMASEVAA